MDGRTGLDRHYREPRAAGYDARISARPLDPKDLADIRRQNDSFDTIEAISPRHFSTMSNAA
jgi:hypothetical protein